MKYTSILEVSAKEWFDKVNGNSYFSATVELDDKTIGELPFQYGYGDHYEDIACQALSAHLVETQNAEPKKPMQTLANYCEQNQIKLISYKQENCKKRDLMK